MIRLLTALDAVWSTPLLQPYFAGLLTEEAVARMIENAEGVCFGDPDLVHAYGTGVVGQIIRARLPADFEIVQLRDKQVTQVVLLVPLPLNDPSGPGFIDGVMVPVLAHVLHRIRLRASAAPLGSPWRAVLTQPVIAMLPAGLATYLKTHYFPNATVRTLGNGTLSLIAMNRQRDADDAVAVWRPV